MGKRYQERRWLLLAGINILVFVYFITSFYFTGTQEVPDLRNYEGLPIISPVIQPLVRLQENLFLLIIVSSSPNKRINAERRNMIRKTWANSNGAHLPNDATFKIVFMMGKGVTSEMNLVIKEEEQKYGDLLIGDYEDSYRNISTKLLMAFYWATKIKCNYVLKTDDDVYVDIAKLVTWLQGQGEKESLYGGVTYDTVVVRKKSHKHYVSPSDLALDRYPVFCKGFMYVLSWKLIPKMVHLSRQIGRIGPDDAYVGILAHQLGVKPVHIPYFFQNTHMPFLIYYFINTCELQMLIGIGDSLTPDQLHYIHKLKTLPNSASVSTASCVDFHVKFWVLILSLCALLFIFLWRRTRRRRSI